LRTRFFAVEERAIHRSEGFTKQHGNQEFRSG